MPSCNAEPRGDCDEIHRPVPCQGPQSIPKDTAHSERESQNILGNHGLLSQSNEVLRDPISTSCVQKQGDHQLWVLLAAAASVWLVRPWFDLLQFLILMLLLWCGRKWVALLFDTVAQAIKKQYTCTYKYVGTTVAKTRCRDCRGVGCLIVPWYKKCVEFYEIHDSKMSLIRNLVMTAHLTSHEFLNKKAMKRFYNCRNVNQRRNLRQWRNLRRTFK